MKTKKETETLISTRNHYLENDASTSTQAKKYNLTEEFSKTRKNFNFRIIVGVFVLVLVSGGLAAWLTFDLGKDADNIAVDVEVFDDINLKALLDKATRVEADIELEKNSLKILKDEKETALNDLYERRLQQIQLIDTAGLTESILVKRKRAIETNITNERKKLIERYNNRIKNLEEEISNLQNQLVTIEETNKDNNTNEKSTDSETIIDETNLQSHPLSQVDKLEKNRIIAEYELTFRNQEKQYNQKKRNDKQFQDQLISNLKARQRETISKLTYRYNPVTENQDILSIIESDKKELNKITKTTLVAAGTPEKKKTIESDNIAAENKPVETQNEPTESANISANSASTESGNRTTNNVIAESGNTTINETATIVDNNSKDTDTTADTIDNKNINDNPANGNHSNGFLSSISDFFNLKEENKIIDEQEKLLNWLESVPFLNTPKEIIKSLKKRQQELILRINAKNETLSNQKETLKNKSDQIEKLKKDIDHYNSELTSLNQLSQEQSTEIESKNQLITQELEEKQILLKEQEYLNTLKSTLTISKGYDGVVLTNENNNFIPVILSPEWISRNPTGLQVKYNTKSADGSTKSYSGKLSRRQGIWQITGDNPEAHFGTQFKILLQE